MAGSFLSAFDLNKTITELQMSEAKRLIYNSRALHAEYRRNAKLVKCVYDLAWEVLKYTLGEENISLPIDVRRVADVLGFVVSSDDFSDVELDYILSDHDCPPRRSAEDEAEAVWKGRREHLWNDLYGEKPERELHTIFHCA